MRDPGSPAFQDAGSGQATSPTSRRVIENLAQAAAVADIHSQRLAEKARQLLKARKVISKVMPKNLFKDSAWDIMLELYLGAIEGGVIYVKQMIIASGERPATGIRIIARLEDAGFIERNSDDLDQRRVIVNLTQRGRQAMELLLSGISERPENLPDGPGKPLGFREQPR